MHGREDEFDRPFGGQALGLERVGEAEAADGEVGAGGAGAIELAVDVLAFGEGGALGQEVEVGAEDRGVQVGGADLDRPHAAFAGEEARERDLELAVGEEEDRAAGKGGGGGGDGLAGAGAGGVGRGGEALGRHGEGLGDGREPAGRALLAEGEGGGEVDRTAPFERGQRIAEEGLGEDHPRAGPDGGQGIGAPRGQGRERAHPHRGQKRAHLVLDHVGQRADDEEARGVGRGQRGDHGGEAGVLALGEGRLDARAGIGQHAHMGRVGGAEAFGGAREVELDDLRGAGTDEEELADVGAAREEAGDLAVELVIGVGEAREVLLLEDRGAEAGFGEDHDARRRLQQMRAGARAHHEEEGILHLAVQPDDAGQAAEHLALAALLQDRRVAAAAGGRGRERGVHAAASDRASLPASSLAGAAAGAGASRRAMRSFHRNCAALTT